MKKYLLASLALLVLVPAFALALSTTNRVELANTTCTGSFVKNLSATGSTFDSILESELPSDYATSDKYCIDQTKTTQCSGAGGATTYAYALYNTSAQTGYTQPISCNQPGGLDENGDPIFPKTGPAKVWTATLRYLAPTATLSASPSSITAGSLSLLTWSSNQGSCTGTNFNTNNASSGSVSVSPSATTEYTLTCGSIVKKATVSVVPPVSLTASDTSISVPDKSTLTWSSVEADFCIGEGIITGGATSGSQEVAPTETTTFTVRCYGSSTTSGPGTWQSGGSDYSDYWCNADPAAERVPSVILPVDKEPANQCDGSVSEGAPCTAPAFCAMSTVQVSCGVSSDFYYCQATGDSVSTGAASVIVTVSGGTPTTPTFAGPGLTCPASVEKGEVATFSLSASDPDGDNIHYGMDWDNSSTVDEWKPGESTYVPSGTKQDFTHSWNTVGTYTIKGLAEDINSNKSGWAQCQVTVTEPGALPECSDLANNDTDEWTDYPADPGCTSPDDTTESPNPDDPPINDPPCYGQGCNGGSGGPGGWGGPDSICMFPDIPQPSANAAQCCSVAPNICFLPICSNGNDEDGDGLTDYNANPALRDPDCSSRFDMTEGGAAAALTLVPRDSFVKAGAKTNLDWTAQNVEPDSCFITGPKFNSGTLSGTSGSVQTPVIKARTTFVLHCTDTSGRAVSVSATIQTQGTVEER